MRGWIWNHGTTSVEVIGAAPCSGQRREIFVSNCLWATVVSQTGWIYHLYKLWGKASDLNQTDHGLTAELYQDPSDVLHGTVESQNSLGGRDHKDNVVLTLLAWAEHLPQTAQSSVQPGLKHFQGRGIHSFSGHPIPVPPHSHSKESLPNR